MASRERARGRKERARKERPVTLVVCEGETEQHYFQHVRNQLRANGIVVRLSDKSNPQAILACAKRERGKLEKEGLDVTRAWVVFDAETEAAQNERRYAETVAEALRAGFSVANSSPCFEYWPLIHFAPGIVVVDPADAERELSKKGRVPGYCKPDLPFGDLWELYRTGKPSEAAARRRKSCEDLGENPRLARPVTFVDELVDELVRTYG